MQDNYRYILIGYSGHAYVVAEAAIECGIKIYGYSDIKEVAFNPFNLTFLGHEMSYDFQGWDGKTKFILGIGDNKIRTKISQLVHKKGKECITVIHPESSVSNLSSIGSGSFVARNASINPFCKIGDNVIVNTSSSIDHECKINSGCHIAPGAVLAGNVVLGENVFVGANSVIKEGVYIGSNSIIGAGSVVLKNIGESKIVYGNPARHK